MTVAVIAGGFAAFDNQRPAADRQTAEWQTLDKLDLALYRAATADSTQQLRVIVRTASGDVDDLVAATKASGGTMASGFFLMNEQTIDQEALAKLDRALQQAASAETTQRLRVIVRTGCGDLDWLTEATEASGGRVVERIALIDAVTAEIGSGDLMTLAANPMVASVSMDGVVESAAKKKGGKGGKGGGDGGDPPPSDPPAQSVNPNHVLTTLGIDSETWSGSGVGVAVIDSGTGAIPGLSLWGHWDFTNGRTPDVAVPELPSDPYGHGTHVGGLIGNLEVRPETPFLTRPDEQFVGSGSDRHR